MEQIASKPHLFVMKMYVNENVKYEWVVSFGNPYSRRFRISIFSEVVAYCHFISTLFIICGWFLGGLMA